MAKLTQAQHQFIIDYFVDNLAFKDSARINKFINDLEDVNGHECIDDKYAHAKSKVEKAIGNLNKLVSDTVGELQVNIEIDQVNKQYQNPAAMPAPVMPAPANYQPPQAPPVIKAFNITPNFTLKRFSKEF